VPVATDSVSMAAKCELYKSMEMYQTKEISLPFVGVDSISLSG